MSNDDTVVIVRHMISNFYIKNDFLFFLSIIFDDYLSIIINSIKSIHSFLRNLF